MAKVAIEIQGLKKNFGKLQVLKGIDLTVEEGTMLALLGPNGAGKTTTVKILSTLLKPDAGTITVGGFNVVTEADKVRSQIGLTGQYSAVDEILTGRQNLIMMGQLYHLSHSDAKVRAEELLTQFDLTEAADRAAKTYSGGMKRRLDLALSLVATPPIIFLDEPTTGLDPRSRTNMWEVIEGLMKEGTTILLTTQYLEEADRLADQIAMIDDGVVIAYGTADELKRKVGTERIEFTIAPESSFEKAVESIEAEGKASNREERTISVSTDGSVKETKRVLDALYAAGIEIDAMSVHKPTLDDAFLRLTGHKAVEEKEV